MKAHINKDGVLEITPKDNTEDIKLIAWYRANNKNIIRDKIKFNRN